MLDKIYLDNAATSGKKPEAVYRAVEDCLRNISANPWRSGHSLSVAASRIVFEARVAVAELIGAADCESVIFTSNATESLNIALKGCLNAGDHVITTSMEHNSVIRPLHHLEKERRVEISVVQCDRDGNLDIKSLERAFKPNTRMVAIIHGSNVTGGIFPLDEVVDVTHANGAIVLVDGSQTVGYLDYNVEKMKIDLLAFSGHKALMGPMGIGCLYVRRGLEVRGLKQGGTGSKSEQEKHPDFLPDRLEAGTPNLPGIAGMMAGVRFVKSVGLYQIRSHGASLVGMLYETLSSIKEVRVLGMGYKGIRTPIISFTVEGMDPAEVGWRLEKEHGIMGRVGLCCSPLAHRTLGSYPAGAVRLSVGYFNTVDEIEKTMQAVKMVVRGA